MTKPTDTSLIFVILVGIIITLKLIKVIIVGFLATIVLFVSWGLLQKLYKAFHAVENPDIRTQMLVNQRIRDPPES